MEDHGFTFAGTETYAASAALMRDGLRPALILLDIEMPDMDGFEVLESLKKTYGKELPPVIFLTAKTDIDFITRSKKSGANGYIIKPVQANRLLERIGEFLALNKPILPYD